MAYTHHVRITVNGVDFTSPGCEGRNEAEALAQLVRDEEGVTKAEVEER